MNQTEIKETSKNWYTLGRNFLPEFDNQAFARIAGQALTFAYEVTGGKQELKLTVDKGIDTAYIDLDSGKIAISAKYFDRNLYTQRFGENAGVDTEALAIALINGSVVHEALHAKYTVFPHDPFEKKTIPTALKLSRKSDEVIAKFGLNTACTAFNIIEDIYIESKVEKNLAPWLQATSDILFSESNLSKTWDMGNLNDYMNLAINWKNKELRNHEAFDNFTDAQLAILQAATKLGVRKGMVARVDLAMDFLNEFNAPDAEAESEEPGEGEGEPQEGEGEASEGQSGDSDSSDSSSAPSEPMEDTTANPGASEEMTEILDSVEGPSDEELEAIKREVEEAADEIAKEKSEREEYTEGRFDISWKKLVERDIMDHRVSGKSVWPTTKIDFNFLKNLVAIRTANRTPGAARNRGSVMVKSRLTRIATDGKIFAKNDSQRNTLKRIEVIINVDFSGSTSGRIINEELGAAKAMSKVLRAAGIAHSVYGHTAIHYGDTPFLFHIFSYDMETTNHNFEERFQRAESIELTQNFDGVVIERLGDKFTGKPGKQFLINLSDGEPAAPGYGGSPAIDHTMKSIAGLREKGIGVFAISVVSHVVESNNRIYGKEFNVDGSRDTNAQFQKLIQKLAV